MKKTFIIALFCAVFVLSCGEIERYPGDDDFKPGDDTEQNPNPKPEPEPEPKPVPDAYTPFTTDILGHAGISYIWDENVIPEITVKMSVEEWNNFLAAYDQRPSNKDYFHCDITYKKGSDVTTITDAGIRLRGNTSRRRPKAHQHVTNGADWQHCHFRNQPLQVQQGQQPRDPGNTKVQPQVVQG